MAGTFYKKKKRVLVRYQSLIQNFEVGKLLLWMVDSVTLVFDLAIPLKFN